EAMIDSLPGVPAGAAFVGSFDRAHAVEDESHDFFASGHPLVEGLLAHIEEAPEGRVARLELRLPGEGGVGVVAIYRSGARFEVRAFDADGEERPAWADALRTPSAALSPMTASDQAAHDWAALATRLAPSLGTRAPYAVAAVAVTRSA